MSQINSFREIIELWPSREAMAADIGVRSWVVSKWWQRKSVPADWWLDVLATERATAAGLTAETLTALAARPSATLDEVNA